MVPPLGKLFVSFDFQHEGLQSLQTRNLPSHGCTAHRCNSGLWTNRDCRGDRAGPQATRVPRHASNQYGEDLIDPCTCRSRIKRARPPFNPCTRTLECVPAISALMLALPYRNGCHIALSKRRDTMNTSVTLANCTGRHLLNPIWTRSNFFLQTCKGTGPLADTSRKEHMGFWGS
jgi:hypothetical protein